MKKLPILNYTIKNESSERLDVYIDGQIVDAATKAFLDEWYDDQPSVSFKSFRDQILNSGLKNVRITINSQGGQVPDAMAMHDFIKQLEKDGYQVETVGMGMICSAATFILSAAQNSKISPNSWYMIHAVSGGAWGTVDDIENYATTLRNFNNSIRDFYVKTTGKSEEIINDWMSRDTWFTGKQAVEHGFVKALETTEQFEQPINAANFMFNNTQALAAYNSLAETPQNSTQNLDMNKLVEAIVNAFKSNKLVVTEENKTSEPLTVENLTSALTTALADVQTEPSEEQIQNSVSKYFENGLPENVLAQITNAVKPAEPETAKVVDDEDFKALAQNVKDIEEKLAGKLGATQPPKNEDDKKYEGVSFE